VTVTSVKSQFEVIYNRNKHPPDPQYQELQQACTLEGFLPVERIQS